MSHQFAIRFQPASGARSVQAEAYVEALSAMLEGLSSLRAALAPELAEKHHWAVPQVRDALTFAVGPTAKGSLVVPLIPGAVESGPPLATDAIAQAFWREASTDLRRVSVGRAVHLSAAGAEAFARASSAANESHAKIGLASRAGRGAWRAGATITTLERALRKHARSRQTGHRAATELSGQIMSLTFDPPGFVLATRSARRSVRMTSALRDRARECWGLEVVVVADAVVAADGGVADIHAIDIRPAASARDADERFETTFGVMRGVWDSEALGAQLGVRNRH